MLSNEEIEKYKQLLKKQEEASQTERELTAEFNMYKKNSAEILSKYGYKSFSDLPKMEEDLAKLEEEMKAQEEEALEYIKYINAKKAERDNIILG